MTVRINVREQSISIVDGGRWGGVGQGYGWGWDGEMFRKSKLFSFIFMTH